MANFQLYGAMYGHIGSNFWVRADRERGGGGGGKNQIRRSQK